MLVKKLVKIDVLSEKIPKTIADVISVRSICFIFPISAFYNININDNCNQNLVFRFEGFAYSHQLSS